MLYVYHYRIIIILGRREGLHHTYYPLRYVPFVNNPV
jgi:hypothetical protein